MATEDAGPSGEPITRVEFTGYFRPLMACEASLKRDLAQDREEACEQLAKKFKEDTKKPSFKMKSHEKQFEFNLQLKEKFETAAAAANATPPALEKVKQALKEGEALINERQKLIKIADRSEHGWATVEEYITDELADDSDDEKVVQG